MSSTIGTVPFIKLPTTIFELKEYIKRRLGAPVIQINIDDQQIYDRIGDALLFYQDYHWDGTIDDYCKWELTQEIIDQRFLPVSDDIIGVVRIFNPQASEYSQFTSIRYQFMSEINAHDQLVYANLSFVDYYLMQTRLSDMDQLFRGLKPVRFNRHEQKLFIEMDWAHDINIGDYIVAQIHRVLDPQIYTGIWSDRFILDYSTALVKLNWGSAIKKFSGVQLPGGIQFNGQQIYDEALAEKKELEQAIIDSGLPPMNQIG